MPPTAPQTPLSPIAGLTAAIRDDAAAQAARRGAVAAMHAQILLTLAAILSRLETMLRLWQVGELVISQPHARRELCAPSAFRASKPGSEAAPRPRAETPNRPTHGTARHNAAAMFMSLGELAPRSPWRTSNGECLIAP